MTTSQLPIIGSTVLVSIKDITDIPAKVDTGADSSAIWASDITINDQNEVEFSLFAPSSPFYTGERLTSTEYLAKRVRSSNGEVSIRYSVPLSLSVEGHRIRARFTLANRERNIFPILIGRKTIKGKFLVDVSQMSVPRRHAFDNRSLNDELVADPHKFHAKYME